MNDTLRYIRRDPIHRAHHHGEITFGLWYAFSEQFVLPISHDEVVHGKGSLLGRMPGDNWQQFANLRAYLGFMFGHPGKKLLFMGCEFAQQREWNHDGELDWSLLEQTPHRGVQSLVRDLNQLYRNSPALYERDGDSQGFAWLVADDAASSTFVFMRRGKDPRRFMVIVCHFTPLLREGYRVGVPQPGRYLERLNTDSAYYGGSDAGAPHGAYESEPIPAHGHTHSIVLRLPPLATVFIESPT
jgi:1,4-alpha-glucan branching enzyme